MCREYAAVRKLISEIAIMDEREDDRIAVISKISLNRLIEGGAAMFAPVNKNHQRVIVGPTHINPLVRKILRVWVISYDILAKENRAEDLKPWAIIIVRAPINPQDVLDSIPASISPM